MNTLGRYTIIRELARSNDIVYEAMDPRLGRRIALKELQIAANLVGQQRQERIARFTREARAAAGLRHPNIVQILEHGQVPPAPGGGGPRYFIAMEFLEGQSLRDILRLRGSLPHQEALRIATCVAEGLEFAHSKGVVHRDIKPDNVHLEPDGRVVITDFGIARLTFEPTLTADGQIFGTPSYMSPEQVKGGAIDKRSDLFSLGVMLYEMVSGRKPFTGDSVVTITYNILNVEPPPPTNAPHGLEQVIRRAIAKEPQFRYASAGQMLEDLRAVAAGQPPRHASQPIPGARPAARPNGASAAPAPRQLPLPASMPPRVAPVAAAGYPPRSPLPAPPSGVPGARPITPARAVSPAYPSPAPAMAAPAPMPQYVPAAPAAPAREGTDLKWLFGWLGVAVVVGLMILALVWAGVSSFEKVQKDTTVRQSLEQTSEAANLVNQAYQELDRKQSARGDVVEDLANRALQLRPRYVPALFALGRARALQGRTEEAIRLYDEALATAEGLARTPGVTAGDLDEARRTEGNIRLWKIDAIYRDGLRLKSSQPANAIARFEQVQQLAAPSTAYYRNAEAELRQLRAAQAPAYSGQDPSVVDPNAAPPLPGSIPGTMGGGPGNGLGGPAGLPGGDPNTPDPGLVRPPGWNPNYGLNPSGGGMR